MCATIRRNEIIRGLLIVLRAARTVVFGSSQAGPEAVLMV